METTLILVLGIFTVLLLSALLLVLLSTNARTESLAVIMAGEMKEHHLAFYELLNKQDENFVHVKLLIAYGKKVALLHVIDTKRWRRMTNKQIRLFYELFYRGDQCLLDLSLAWFKDEEHMIPTDDHEALRAYYWNIRNLIHFLPQRSTYARRSKEVRYLCLLNQTA